MTSDLRRIITPDSDPGRFTREEAAMFSSGRCSWQVDPSARGASQFCGAPSKPGASFGHCAGHEAEMLEDYWPDGTPRR